MEGPDQPVLGEGVVGGQIVFKGQVSGVPDQGALDDGGVAVPPALGRVQGLRLGADGDDHAVLGLGLRLGLFLCLGGLSRGAAGQQHREGQQQRCKGFPVHMNFPFLFRQEHI